MMDYFTGLDTELDAADILTATLEDDFIIVENTDGLFFKFRFCDFINAGFCL